ncbi:hypothetical protein RhiJN_17950 [Ceratobasidium sp. AG-Ba]|nr:hypothetical protein RhiJN_17950 [Ceratobasidium sp. AG-Ba]
MVFSPHAEFVVVAQELSTFSSSNTACKFSTSDNLEGPPGKPPTPPRPKTPPPPSAPAGRRELDGQKPPPLPITPPPKPPKSKAAFPQEDERLGVHGSETHEGVLKPTLPPPGIALGLPFVPSLHGPQKSIEIAKLGLIPSNTLPEETIQLGELGTAFLLGYLRATDSAGTLTCDPTGTVDEHFDSVIMPPRINSALLSLVVMSGNEREGHEPPPRPATPPPKPPKNRTGQATTDPREPACDLGPERAPKPVPPPPHPDPVGPPPRPGKRNSDTNIAQRGRKGMNETPKVPPRPTTPPPPPPPRNDCQLKGHEPPPPPPVAPPKPPKSASAQGMALDAEHVYAPENAQLLLEMLMHLTRRPPDICKPLAQPGSLRASANEWHAGGGTHMVSVVA